ncbi:OB-fold domain-containing protein [uncultured Reyranella sp.]|uniref:hydroxymethylglutaryl-CoA synthase family protein n=1 Tax=uncultured Reyranella sp. TaxID=735512 RepID=UPI0025F933B3|nr:OB-fold domain-containing protein [uncultured Reyranella sp.]
MVGIVAYGAYVPRLRLNRQAVYEANKWFAPGLRGLSKGERSMANWDEDSITMAVEASRDCLTSHKAEDVRNIYFASTTHPFKDRQNAGVIGTALNVEQNLSAMDVGGSLKAGTSALIAGLNASRDGAPSLVAAADKRMARVASANELNYGDGAAALLCGTENVIARLVGHHSVSMDFVDHFRGEDAEFDYGWEERWIRDEGYAKIVPPAIKAALAACKLTGGDITHFIMPSLMPAVPKLMAKMAGIGESTVRDLMGASLGDTGAAHALVMLVDALESAKAGDRIMVVAFGQGVDALVFEVTAEKDKLPARKGLSGWMARRKEEKNYMKFLAFNDMLPIDKGMRAEFDKKTALSVLWRKRDMIYGLVGGKCRVCGTVQFPRSQVCVNPNCHAMDSQDPYAMAGLECSVMSFTADSLTYSPDPPAYYGMITFPEGGRFMADFTDSDKDQVKVGAKMRMTFRIRDNDQMRGGFKRYFWKATPV